uniref:glucuronosyltransferase n=1 Tax=Steinernema glaseri TaxID=37863 RepID=A0A1I7YIZ7_9BILA
MRLVLFLAVIAAACDGYRILVFSPTISRSHMISNGRIADELAKAGHEVILFEPEFRNVGKSVKSAKHATVYRVGGFTDEVNDRLQLLTASTFKKDWIPVWTRYQTFKKFPEAVTRRCEEMLLKADVIEKLRSYKFDLYFGEQLNLCGSALSHVLGIKTHFWISSCPIMDHMSHILKIPTPLSYVPAMSPESMSDKPTYIERVTNIFDSWFNTYLFDFANRMTTDLYRKHFGLVGGPCKCNLFLTCREDFPDVDDIVRESPIIFVTSDEYLDFPRPILNNVVYIGGLGIEKKAAPLSEPFKSEVKKGKKGVIYFSFGTNVKSNFLPEQFVRNLFAAFAKFPDYRVIFKHESDDEIAVKLAKNTSNVFITKWAPQTDLLSVPEMKVFITHGGYNSLLETAIRAVPVITMSFFGDQSRNGRLAERNGWGIPVDKRKLLEGPEVLITALEKVLNDPTYKEQALRSQKLVTTKPYAAADRLVKYTEFVAANGGRLPELQIEGRHLSYAQLYNLDIIVPVLCIFVFFCFLLVKLVCRALFSVVSMIVRVKKNKTE